MPKNDKDPASPPAYENAAFGFVFKSLNRDPNKRKIKPVESILSMEADLDDSESDDSDYNPPNKEIDDIEIESDEDGDKLAATVEPNKKKKSKNKSKFHGDDKTVEISSQSDDDNDESDSDSNSYSGKESHKNDQSEDASQAETTLNDKLLNRSPEKTKHILSDAERASRYKKLLICAVCLGEVSHNDDEIVECDACGISVHELCYGISSDDTESIHSDASSASTEPWFCEPCKANVKNPLCGLCPNQGGIYKVSNTGEWIHMVCALYTPGISFLDPEKMFGPSLSGINYVLWGSKICILCEDRLYSETGVCICCDAGMCKTYFHVTCAQREGLLFEPQQGIDPFIAYCRLHSDRQMTKKKRQNYLVLAHKYRLIMENQKNLFSIEDSITNQRTLDKLYIQREKFQKNLLSLPKPSLPDKKTPRLLEASPSAMRRLDNRCDLAGFHISRISQAQLRDELFDIRRKWHIPPAFSPEFIFYYLDRDERMTQMQAQYTELLQQNKDLKEVESEVFDRYNKLIQSTEQLRTENESIRSKIRRYSSILNSFNVPSSAASSSTNQSLNDDANRDKFLEKILNLPEMIPIDSTSSSGKSQINSKFYKLKKEFHSKECATCKKSTEQHLMALCDSCHLYYHLHCLDPPLRRMPKKTRFGGWQCSNCTENEEQEMDDDLNKSESRNGTFSSTNDDSTANSEIGGQTTVTSTRRRLRDNPKATSKYNPDPDDSSNPAISLSTQSANKRRTKSTRQNSNSLLHSNNNNRRGRRPRKSSASKTKTSASISPATPTTTTSNTLPPTVSIVTGINNRKRKLSNGSENISETPLSTKENGDSNLTLVSTNKSSLLKRTTPSFECSVCKAEVVSMKQSVRCDNCGNDYHFSCLKPPCTKSPKRRGYTWCCFVCEKKDQKRSSDSHITTNPVTNSDSIDTEIKELEKETNSLTNSNNKTDKKTSRVVSEETLSILKKTQVEVGSEKSSLNNVNDELTLDNNEKSAINSESEINCCESNIDPKLGNFISNANEIEKSTRLSNLDCQSSSEKANPIGANDSDHQHNENSQSTNVDDINTVLNDIIMLEEEAEQQTNKTPTTPDQKLDTDTERNDKDEKHLIENQIQMITGKAPISEV